MCSMLNPKRPQKLETLLRNTVQSLKVPNLKLKNPQTDTVHFTINLHTRAQEFVEICLGLVYLQIVRRQMSRRA